MRILQIFVVLGCTSVLAITGLQEAVAAGKEKDWPCVQRKREELSVGAIWSASEISEKDLAWQKNKNVLELVNKLSQRRLSIEDAQKEIDNYAGAQNEEKRNELILLFTGLFQTLNNERREIVNGIVRFSKKQQALANKIKKTVEESQALRSKKDRTNEENKKLEELEKKLSWDTRIFDEREQSLQYVCESPVIIEQRLFALSRKIQEHLQ